MKTNDNLYIIHSRTCRFAFRVPAAATSIAHLRFYDKLIIYLEPLYIGRGNLEGDEDIMATEGDLGVGVTALRGSG